jgi:hypothetical protein
VDRRTKIQALSLAKDVYALKMELLTTSTVADDAIRFVASSPNNNEPTIRIKATANYETEIEKENIRPINLVNEPFQEQQPEVENNTTMTSTTNQVV